MFDRCSGQRIARIALAVIAAGALGCKDEKTRLPFLFAETPSAVVEGSTPVFYTLVQQSSTNTTVSASFTADQGRTFKDATLAPGSPSLVQLLSKPEGERFNFFWDPLADLGPGLHRDVILSLFGAGEGARPSQTGPFTVDLSDRLAPLTGLDNELTFDEGSAVALADGSILLGGLSAQGQREAGLRRYRPLTNTAPSAGSLSQARTSLGAARLADGSVLFAGGRTDAGASTTLDRWAIDSSEVVTVGQAGVLATPRIAPLVAPLSDGRALILGGQTASGVPVSGVELFTAATGVSAAYSSPLATRAGATATRLGDGRVLIAGGLGPSGLVRETALIAGASLAEITTGSQINSPRVEHAAVLLPDGRVFLVGGSLALGDDAQALTNAEIFDPATGGTTSVAAMNHRRRAPAAAYTDGSIVVFGGTGSVDAPTTAERYELSTGTWHLIAAPSGTPRQGAIAATTGPGHVLVLGGNRGPERYYPDADLVAGTYDVIEDLPAPRADHTATALNDLEVLVAGGTDGIRTATASAEVFNLEFRTFTTVSSMRRARAGHAAALVLSSEVLVAGGVNELGQFMAETEFYDPRTKTWVDAGSIAHPRRDATLTRFGPLGAPIYALVGGVDALGNPVAEVEVWDGVQRSWSVLTTLPNPRSKHQVAVSDRYFFVGPGEGTGGQQSELQRLDPFNNLNRVSLTLDSVRGGAGMAFFRAPNRVVISGGRDAGGVPLASLVMVEPEETAGPTLIPGTLTMATARSEHLSIRLDEFFGEVLFIGGRGASGLAQDHSEILRLLSRFGTSSVQGSVTVTGDPYLNRPRLRHTATQLRDRRVLILGGVDERGSVIAGAELFLP
jgi:galactose oxidase-like protein/Kelch motif protein